MDHTVTITVSGTAGAGKSCVAQWVYKALREAGVSNVCIDDIDEARSPERQAIVLSSIAPLLHVRIFVRQEKRLSSDR